MWPSANGYADGAGAVGGTDRRLAADRKDEAPDRAAEEDAVRCQFGTGTARTGPDGAGAGRAGDGGSRSCSSLAGE